MNNIIQKGHSLFNKYSVFFFMAVFLLWIKTYIAQITQFKLGVEGPFQHFLLFINPLGSSLLFLGIALFFKGRKKYSWLMVIYFILTVLLYSNILYYRFFNDFITLPTLTQTKNAGEIGGSVVSLLKPYDFLFFIDFLLLLAFLAFRFVKMEIRDVNRGKINVLFSLTLSISCAHFALAELDRPELLTRGFDRNYIVKYLGLYNYVIYDAVQSTQASTQRVMANSDDISEIYNYTKSNYAEPNPDYFGVGKGMNVVFFHLESFQNFLIDYKLHGEEVTPFLNSLTKDKNTTYFDNFFHQTAHGKTSDAEFILENSLYGLPQGSAFMTKSLNTYQAAPAILGNHGYTSAVFHGNSGSFWNRDEVYKSFGYDRFFDSSYYNMEPEDLAQYGLMDKPFLKESMPLLKSLPQPFYTKLITVTNHFPFPIDKKDATIAPHTTGVPSVDSYFQTARYADEALKQFFTSLEQAGLLDHTIIIMYGDHYGISKENNEEMEQVLGKKITPFESTGLQRVPLLIRVPGIEGRVNHEYSGQIDILPTVLHLLGIDTKEYIQFGTDLFSKQHDDLIPFRNGDFVSSSITSIDGKFYDSTTGMELENDKLAKAQKAWETVEQKLLLSDKVVNGDLLRFYTPKDFVPVDRTKYNYHH
ncbi:glycerol phosphate lipoteichoic acid synthase [Bacillus sp. MUM 116]|uniref:LTA synthase family protein n=1 Tax=Bacillus sp. MUM 116 TaxID=1678002 RepID=UPI0008F597C4|nr:LTA synthase family protein [Bacillus sp. MUM 116]OIK13717.1 glycerol phosphate lipoteichoic acid synthase [Bacillus sp. MUM 116]